MMPTKERHLEAIAATAKPVADDDGARMLTLGICLHPRGHASIDATGAANVPVNDDEDLVRRIAQIVAMTRQAM
jgi:hypothetical protein